MSENEQDAEFPVEESATPKVEIEPEQKPTKSAGGVAWLAFLLSIIAVAAVGYRLVEDWRQPEDTSALDTANDLRALENRLGKSDDAVQALSTRVDALPRRDLSDDIEAVRSDLDDRLRLLSALPARMSTLENSVASLAGISEGARETFLLAEAEYYMQIANAQLQLANNPQLATLALKMADERIAQLADPGLTDVRRALSDELAALEVMEKPDLEGTSLKLASLAGVIDSLPLASGTSNAATTEESGDESESSMSRAWASVKDAMSGLVKVTPPEQAKLARLSPDAEYFLRNNVALQLQAARLALLRGERAIFEQTLDDASALMTGWFNLDSEQVANALETIETIRGGRFSVAPPDISESLRRLRQFRTVRETVE